MFSDQTVQDLSGKFICVKIDPRESREALHLKRTRFVPEVLFVDDSERVLATLEDRSVAGVVGTMREVLER